MMTPTTITPEEQYDDVYAVCPYCLTKHGDCWEWVTENDEITICDECGKKFTVRAEYSVTYYSNPIEQQPVEVQGVE